MPEDSTHTTLLDLEERGWRSLCDGTGSEFYGGLMSAESVMTLAGGLVLDRDGVVASLAQSPTWDSFALTDVVLSEVTPDAALLRYTGTARRDGQDPFVARMASLYVQTSAGWRLAHYQQTQVG